MPASREDHPTQIPKRSSKVTAHTEFGPVSFALLNIPYDTETAFSVLKRHALPPPANLRHCLSKIPTVTEE